jgi:GNAT superfamily N-acetyltransferase
MTGGTSAEALALRIETTEARGPWCDEAISPMPESTLVLEACCGGLLVFAGADSPLTRGRGVGMGAAVTPADVDRLEAFFLSRGARVTLQVCPFAHPSLFEELARRGYRFVEIEHVSTRALEQGFSPAPLPSGIEVRATTPDEATLWATTVARGFADDDSASAETIAAGTAMIRTRGALCFLAFAGGEAAGAGAMTMRDGLASLFATSVRAPFRRRGVQAALLDARLALAARSGCDLATVTTSPGSPSQRNVERRGFRVVYSRTWLERAG